MTKIQFLNDTNSDIHIHPATKSHGVECDMSPIKPLEKRVFSVEEGEDIFIKQWSNGSILISTKF